MTFSKRYRATLSGDMRRSPFRVQVRPYSFSRPKIRRVIWVAAGISRDSWPPDRECSGAYHPRLRHPRDTPAGIDALLVLLPPCTVLSIAAYATRAELPRPGRRVPILLTGAAPRYIDIKRSRSDSKVFRLSPSRVVFTRWPEPVRHAS